MNKLEPRIRFDEFYDEWNKNKIKNISEKIKSYSVSRKYETKESTGLKYVHYGDIHTDVADIVKKDNDLPFVDYKKAKECLENGDLVIADASEDYDGIANACLIKDIDEKIIAGLHTIALRLSSEISPLYFYYLTKSEKFKKFCIIMATGAKVYGITYNNIANYILDLPDKEEQEKIGAFFEKLDKLIENQESYLNLNKKLKKSLLQKLFPKEGEDRPELRFPGFKDDWKEYKLKNICESYGGSALEKEFTSDGSYKVISIGSYGINSKYIDQGIRTNLNKKTKSKLLNKDDLVMILNDKTSSGDIIGRVLLIDKSDTYIYNQRSQRIILSKGFDSNFFYQMFNSNKRDKIRKIVQGNTQIYVNWKSVSNLNYLIPTLEEQEKIGLLFKSLDEKIESEEKKLRAYKDFKKSMLQKMFV